MRKIISVFLISLLLISTSFWYSLSNSDKKMVDTFLIKVEKLNFTEKKLDSLLVNINKLKTKYSKNEKLSTILSEMTSWIESMKNTKTTSNIANKEVLYKVLKVTDGDTIQIDYNWVPTSVRILWLDTPEKYATRTWYKECYWEEASYYAFQELSNREVLIEFDETQDKVDKYGRLLAHVFYYNEAWEKVFFQEKMIKEGYGFYYLYKTPVKYADILIKAQDESKKENKGVWWKCNWERKPLDQVINETSESVSNVLDENSSSNSSDTISSINDEKSTSNSTNTEDEKAFAQSSRSVLSQSAWQWDTQKETYYRTTVYEDYSQNYVYFKNYTKSDFPSSYSCDVKKTCTVMSSCQEAIFYLKVCWSEKLDSDKDGIPCESKCPYYKEVKTVRETSDNPTE